MFTAFQCTIAVNITSHRVISIWRDVTGCGVLLWCGSALSDELQVQSHFPCNFFVKTATQALGNSTLHTG